MANVTGQNTLRYIFTLVKNVLGQKVDKVNGKVLTTNDYTNEEKQKVSTCVAGLANKTDTPTTVKMVIPAVSWSGNEAPFASSLAVAGVLADEKQLLLITPQAVAANDQVTAWFEAAVLGGTQTTGHITLKAYGKKPEIDIPVNIVIGGVTK